MRRVMALDYDTPAENSTPTSCPPLPSRRVRDTVETDETGAVEFFDLPGADLSTEQLTAPVIPRQQDEFVCTRCFLVHHHNRRDESADAALRPDCG